MEREEKMPTHDAWQGIQSCQVKSGGRPLDLVKQKQIERLFRKGFSDREIAAKLRSTLSAIRTVRRKLGLRHQTTVRGQFPVYMDKVCFVCGKIFVPLSGRQIYCSPTCKRKSVHRRSSGQDSTALTQESQ